MRRSIASLATSSLDSSAVMPPRHSASARRACPMSAALSAAPISENAWLKRRKPISRYRTATFQASPSSGCTASSTQNVAVAISTGGASATTIAIAPCCAVPPSSLRSRVRT
jgi:hypothetical protein